MSLLTRFGRLAAWGGVSWFVPLIITIAAIPFLLHSLGQAKMGLLFIFIVTPAVAAQLDLGLTSIVIRRLSPMAATGRVLIFPMVSTFAICYSVVGALIALGVALFASDIASLVRADSVIGSDGARICVILCALWLFVASIGTIPGVIARACQRMRAVALAQVATALGFWGGALLVAFLQWHLAYFIILGVAVTAVVGISLWWSVRDVLDFTPGKAIDAGLVRTDARSSSWFFLGQLCSIGLFQLDRAVVSMLAGPAAAAAYSVAANISNKLLASSSSLLTFLMPYAAAVGTTATAEIGLLVRQSERLLALALVPTVIPVWLSAEALMRWWLGQEAAPEVAEVLKILWAAFVIPAIVAPTGNAFLALGSPAVAAAFSLLSVSVFLALLWLLAPAVGTVGAGLAVLGSMCTSVLFHSVARRRLGMEKDADSTGFRASVALGVAIQAAIVAAFGLIVKFEGQPGSILLAIFVWLSFYLSRALIGKITPLEVIVVRQVLSSARTSRRD